MAALGPGEPIAGSLVPGRRGLTRGGAGPSFLPSSPARRHGVFSEKAVAGTEAVVWPAWQLNWIEKRTRAG